MNGLVIDNFAGGGGASLGIEWALGRPVDIAINHDDDAIAMHEANHPETKHFVQSITSIDPLDAVTFDGTTATVDLTWFSPDCKHHSKAKGGKPRDKRIRDLAWVVVHWLERLGPLSPIVLYLENVEEFRKWGPLDENDKPIKAREGEEFDLWVRRIRKCGYKVEWRELVAADYGAPTTRKRLYLIARKDGAPIVWPQRTHAPRHSEEVAAGKLLPWVASATCIDWDTECPSIFERKRPLKPNTMRRIAHGVVRYGLQREPFIVPVTNAKWAKNRSWSSEEPLRTVTTAKGGEYAAVDAGMVPLTHQGAPDRTLDSQEPFKTVTGAHRGGVAKVTASLVGVGGRRGQSPPKSVADPHPVITTKGDSAIAEVIMVPHITKFRGGAIGSDAGEPMPTITANGEPKRPAGAQPLALAGVTLVQTGYGERKGQAPRALDPQEPLGTVVAAGGKHAAGVAFLSQFRGSNKTGSGGDLSEPARTVTAGGTHQALITAHIEQANGGPRNKKLSGRSPTVPLSTVTVSGSQQRIIETTLVDADDLPPLLLMRAARVAAFLTTFYLHDDIEELPGDEAAVMVGDKVAVITVTIDGNRYVMVDIGMRMLKPRELARAMGVPDSYILDPLVTKKYKNGRVVTRPLTISEQISKIGNMVCPIMAKVLVAANSVKVDEGRAVA